jgi:NADH-quinone oxidoreductase subunit C
VDNNTITAQLNEKFGSSIQNIEDPDGIITYTINSKIVTPFIQYLKEQLGYNFLTDLCGVHYPEKELNLCVVYHLHNFQDNKRLRLKSFISANNPVISTTTGLFPAANWMERETFDFYGIIFEGHPDLKRILNVDYLDYYPMRKEYPLEDPTRHDKDDRFFGR